MNLSHLGDALDYWKGSVIEMMRDGKLQVVPMFTDLAEWAQEDIETYARLLHVEPDDILKRGKDDLFSNATRDNYFRNLGEHDLFLDPDTGIALSRKAARYVVPSEIIGLLPESRSRVLLIYQHASRKANGVKEKLKSLRDTECLEGCVSFAYDCGAVSMVVISRSRKRTGKILAQLKWLSPVASRRIVK